ncbi:MAG: hypothetical protein QM820_41220 [Minicystis sp.]
MITPGVGFEAEREELRPGHRAGQRHALVERQRVQLGLVELAVLARVLGLLGGLGVAIFIRRLVVGLGRRRALVGRVLDLGPGRRRAPRARGGRGLRRRLAVREQQIEGRRVEQRHQIVLRQVQRVVHAQIDLDRRRPGPFGLALVLLDRPRRRPRDLEEHRRRGRRRLVPEQAEVRQPRHDLPHPRGRHARGSHQVRHGRARVAAEHDLRLLLRELERVVLRIGHGLREHTRDPRRARQTRFRRAVDMVSVRH